MEFSRKVPVRDPACRMSNVSAREKAVALKEVNKLEAMLKDCRVYEKTLFSLATQKIEIDLDDGVKVNYQKFKDVLVAIKGFDELGIY